MTRVVHLHVGAPKTGTTYIQTRLSRNRRSLARHGVHFPSGSRLVRPELSHFRAALDLKGEDWGGPPGHAEGAWPALMRRVRRLDGNVIISHEILGAAEPDVAARAVRDLGGTGGDTEVHVVYSARDLGRQLPGAWQESVKQGRSWSFARFLKRARRGTPFFMQSFDAPAVLETWGRYVPREQIHLVVVPQRREPEDPAADSLWTRMCRALDIDPAWAPDDPVSANESLGAAETYLLRQLNKALGRKIAREGEYDELVRDLVASGALFPRRTAPVTLPPDAYGWVAELAERSIEWIAESGVDVVGDLEELRPVPPDPDAPWSDPDRVRKRVLVRTATAALAGMTRETARRPDPERTLPKAAGRELRRRLQER